MRLPLLLCVTTLAASAVLAQQAGSPSSPSSADKSTQPGISSPSSSSTLSPTGRGSGQQQHFRSTKVIGAQVKSSSGEDVGRIEDVVINPTSGRIDFAVISAESKLCPVPWQLLSVSSSSAQGGTSTSSSTQTGTSTSTTPGTSPTSPSATTPSSTGIYASASMGQPTFTLNIDKSKLQSGPSFDRSRWPEMSASWSQRVYSHYGVQPETGVGGTGTGSTSSQSDQGSTGTSTDSTKGSSTDKDKDKDKSSPEDKK
jgi:sporulation protein YlmC with PRC-barrel domain